MTVRESFVRALPEHLALVETYRYRFDIARASSSLPVGEATGKLRALFPYQASEWFPVQAATDLSRQEGKSECEPPGSDGMVTVGHLLFADWGRTDLEAREPGDGIPGSVPLRIPEPLCRQRRTGDSAAHRRAALTELEYLPDPPGVVPLQVDAEILDRETLDAQEISDLIDERKFQAHELEAKLARRPEDSPGLLLVLDLCLTLEDPRVGNGARSPCVERIVLRWPTIPCPGSLVLLDLREPDPGSRSFDYQPEKRTVEWVPRFLMKRIDQGVEPRREKGTSRWKMRLVVALDEVADLAGESYLEGQVEVSVPGALVSGLDVRHYDARGARVENRLRFETRILADLRLGLDHLLRRQTRSVVHHLFLEGVRLDERRIADVCSTFADCGLKVREPWTGDGVEGGAVVVDGERLVEGERLHLIARLQGHHHSAVRTTELAGGRRYSTTLATGDVDLTLHGLLRGSNDALCSVVDAVHGRLRDVFGVTADHR